MEEATKETKKEQAVRKKEKLRRCDFPGATFGRFYRKEMRSVYLRGCQDGKLGRD